MTKSGLTDTTIPKTDMRESITVQVQIPETGLSEVFCALLEDAFSKTDKEREEKLLKSKSQ